MQPEKHPLDFEALKPGDFIPAEKVSEIIGKPIGTPAFQFGTMALIQRINRELLDIGQDRNFTVVQRQNGIKILPHNEASTHNNRQFYRSIDKMKRASFKMNGVDRSQLDERERQIHDRKCQIQGFYVASIVDAGRLIESSKEKQIAKEDNGSH